jgi:surface carbohydrate biosynthesis protein
MNMNMERRSVVILVDNKRRDLPGAALLAHHLERNGVEVFLEPLGAWRAVLAAYKPHMIIFNHLLGSHLVRYSRELHERGILVGVLPNEGILYNEEVLEFNASKFHNDAHIDYFFVWNEAHKRAIEKAGNPNIKRVEIVGVPRFDFYFPPLVPPKTTPSPTILVCTNFVFAQYLDKDPSVADRLFAPWKDRVSSYRDYWDLIRTNHRSRELFFRHLDAIVSSEKNYNVILKPHPGEDVTPYEEWYAALDPETKKRVRFDRESLIWELIPQCDAEIACETCTTTLESWIAGKPTIELLLEKHPVFYHEFLSRMTLTCDNPERIEEVIEEALSRKGEEEFAPMRREHLARWCASPDGHATERLASLITDAVEKTSPNFDDIDLSHRRKGWKLRFLHSLEKPYNYKPLSLLKGKIFPKRHHEILRIYDKTIKPEDVRHWSRRLEAVYRKDGSHE